MLAVIEESFFFLLAQEAGSRMIFTIEADLLDADLTYLSPLNHLGKYIFEKASS